MLFYNWYLLGVKNCQATPTKQDLGVLLENFPLVLLCENPPANGVLILSKYSLWLTQPRIFFNKVSPKPPYVQRSFEVVVFGCLSRLFFQANGSVN